VVNIESRESGFERLVDRVWRERILLTVHVTAEDRDRLMSLALHSLPMH
jgi:hypothetical protein